jgi:hypothetical protein
MKARVTALAVCAMLGTTLSLARAADASAPQEGVEVLTRGAVHEAYAEPGLSQPAASPIINKQPPDAVNELPPDQKPEGQDVQWIPGYWTWDEERNDFVWLSGFWRVPPPGRQWVPGSWRQVQGGWQWSPGFWATAEQGQLDYLPPPPDPVEIAPSVPAPSADSIFVPGVWVFRETRWFWRPGCWIAYRPGWVWVPAHYVWTPAGYVFVEGYWDYSLRDRGLLFAPVVIERRFLLRRDWTYVPRFVVYDDFLQCSLFVRPRFGCYYFGDYFGPRYEKQGFVAWVDFRIGRSCYDPLFSFYLRTNANRRGWERDLRGLYADRFAGKAPLPPRTLVQQNTLIQNINNKRVNVTNVRNVTVVTPLAQMDRKAIRLESVSREQFTRERAATTRLLKLGTQRREVESQLLSKGPAPSRSTDAARRVKLDLPATTRTGRDEIKIKTPPASPITSRLVEQHSTRTEHSKPTGTPKKEIPLPPATRKESTPPPPDRHEHKPPPGHDVKSPPKTDKHEPKPPKKDAAMSARYDFKSSPPPAKRSVTTSARHEDKAPAPRHEAKAAPAVHDKKK